MSAAILRFPPHRSHPAAPRLPVRLVRDGWWLVADTAPPRRGQSTDATIHPIEEIRRLKRADGVNR